jgi:hypothetical protein
VRVQFLKCPGRSSNTTLLTLPVTAAPQEFENFGHLDFTLSLDDDIITHVLRHLVDKAAAGPQLPRPPPHAGGAGGAPSLATSLRPLPVAAPATDVTADEPAVADVPYIHHEVLHPPVAAGGAGAAEGVEGAAKRHGSPNSYDAPPAAAPVAEVVHSSLAHEAFARIRDGVHGAWLAPQPAWLPSRECAAHYPWLHGFTKADVVFDGLDAEARDMGLDRG